ncbi:DUF2314 domain-containing protein [Chryseobacterium sp.]|uniref:DUF2314 domain-containing protein n=1 Tax=Chryseobacterium sp. TaxID=1871047 RepID=UPI00388E0885
MIFLLLLNVACEKKYSTLKRDSEPDVSFVESDDGAMNEAIDKAQKSIHCFDIALENNNPNSYNYTLKESFPTVKGNEHLWIGEIQKVNGRYYGVVQNNPIDVKDVKFGDSVEVPFNRISDWMYYDGDTIRGAFTVKVLRKSMSEIDRKAIDPEGMIYEK